MPFELDRLRRDLRPFRLRWVPRVRSTNDWAATLRRRGELFAPAAVVAGHQLAGRGRGANSWWSGAGSLTVTFALPVADAAHGTAHQVPLLAGLAVRAAAAELTGIDAIQLKWPNDVLHAGRKVAGLLCERVDGVDLIGIGLNVDCDLRQVPRPLRLRVTSLNALACRSVDLTDAAVAVGRHLGQTLGRQDDSTFAAALREYDRHHALVGRRVTIVGGTGEPDVAGIVQGLDAAGRLLLRDRGTVHRIVAGHVILA